MLIKSKYQNISDITFSHDNTAKGVRSLIKSFVQHNNIFLPRPIKTKSTASKTP